MIKRLYDQFQPSNYQLELKIDKERMIFTGTAVIKGDLRSSAQSIELHAKDLRFDKAQIDGKDAEWVEPELHDVLEIRTTDHLGPGEHTVTLEFAGKITDQMHGMYPCYFKHEGKKKKLIATQFESHHAREVFPCIDEPEAKATFDITLHTALHEQVLSNMPQKHQTKSADFLITTFEQTPKMSTYLVAFVAGEMHYKDAVTKDGIMVRSWATPAQPASHLDYSVKEAVDILEFYNDYFKTPYPLPKCDQVALPDFDAGAMENWGLITYREVALLADPKNRSLSSEQYVSIVIAHELSHQWFGNLVTMKWWDDLWLNESFASIIEHVAVDALHSDWNIWETYTATDAVFSSSRDVFSKVQPVGVDVNDPDQITSLFDPAIVYAKGGRLLKMLREYIGEEAFRSGLKSYFKKHAYKNTTRADLWEEFANASGKDIHKLMKNWLEKSGMPVVTIDQQGNRIALSQQRLLLDSGNDTDTIWHIPLLADQNLSEDILASRDKTITTPKDDFVVLNANASAHFVSHYKNQDHIAHLATQLAEQAVPAETRMSLLNDQILLARQGNESLTTALELIAQMSHEPRHAVWSLISMVIGNAKTLTEGDAETEKLIKHFTKKLASPLHEKYGWESQDGEDPNATHMRNTLIGLMIAGEDEEALAHAHTLYASEKNPADLPSELRPMLMGVMVRHYDQEAFDQLLELYKATGSADLQEDIASALASTKSEKRAQQLTTFLTDAEVVRPQDLFRWFAYLMRNRHTREAIWDWLEENWGWVEITLGSGKSYDYFPLYGAKFISTTEWQTKYRKFFEPKRLIVALERNIDVGLDEIEARIAWRQRDEANIKTWLKEHSN